MMSEITKICHQEQLSAHILDPQTGDREQMIVFETLNSS